MELAKTLVIPFEKTINFGKSSGGKQEESHLGKLDTFNEISRKNYFTKYIEEKSFSTSKTITKSEFYKRRSPPFENLSRTNDFRSEKAKKTFEANQLGEKGLPSEIRQQIFRETFPLTDLSGTGTGCEAKEKQMTQKLREIHQLIQQMQDMTEKSGIEERKKDINKFFFQPDVQHKTTFEKTRCFEFETSCELKRKLVPAHFASSFTTELGSTRKAFAEQIIFQNCYVPEFSREKSKLFKSTLEIACRLETMIQLNNLINFSRTGF